MSTMLTLTTLLNVYCVYLEVQLKKSIDGLKWNSKKNSSNPKEGSKGGTKGKKTEGKSKNQIKHEL